MSEAALVFQVFSDEVSSPTKVIIWYFVTVTSVGLTLTSWDEDQASLIQQGLTFHVSVDYDPASTYFDLQKVAKFSRKQVFWISFWNGTNEDIF